MITETNEGFAEEFARKMEKAKRDREEEDKRMEEEKENLRQLRKEGRRIKIFHRSHIKGREPHNKQKEK